MARVAVARKMATNIYHVPKGKKTTRNLYSQFPGNVTPGVSPPGHWA